MLKNNMWQVENEEEGSKYVSIQGLGLTGPISNVWEAEGRGRDVFYLSHCSLDVSLPFQVDPLTLHRFIDNYGNIITDDHCADVNEALRLNIYKNQFSLNAQLAQEANEVVIATLAVFYSRVWEQLAGPLN